MIAFPKVLGDNLQITPRETDSQHAYFNYLKLWSSHVKRALELEIAYHDYATEPYP